MKSEALKRSFNSPPEDDPLRILIATDAAREGVNLQNHCRYLCHFDVPWNPGRMEQRNGRIDRTLQRAPEVFCHYFVLTAARGRPRFDMCWCAKPRRSAKPWAPAASGDEPAERAARQGHQSHCHS